jgi:hypothetical protein
MRRVHGVRKNHRLIRAKRIQQLLVSVDEPLLLARIQAAAHRFGLFVFKAEPMQQRDQSRAALVGDAENLLDEHTHLPRRTRQGLRDISAQLFFLRLGKMAGAASGLEAPKAFDASLIVGIAPTPDRVVVKIKRLGGPLATPTVVRSSIALAGRAKRCSVWPSRSRAINSARCRAKENRRESSPKPNPKPAKSQARFSPGE